MILRKDEEMNVYDFDKTIYDGDSTFNFYKYCLRKKPWLIFGLWRVLIPFIKYLFGKGTKTAFKEKIYESFLPKIDRETYLEDFWKVNVKKIKKFYLDNQKEDDIIISASPVFIVKPCTDKLGIKYLYASNVDPDTGKYDGINCHGAEKVRRFEEAGFKREDVDEFYSDSLSDTPLAEISKAPFIVDGDELIPWDDYKPGRIKKLFGKRFVRFMMCGCVSCIIALAVTYLISHLLPDFRIDMGHFHMSNIVFAHFAGYVLSLPCSYVLNSKFSFKQSLCIKKCGKFCLSYVPNYLLQMLVVFVTVDLMHLDKLLGLALAVFIATPVTFFIMKVFAFGDKRSNDDSDNDASEKKGMRSKAFGKKSIPILIIFLVLIIVFAMMCTMLFPKKRNIGIEEKQETAQTATHTEETVIEEEPVAEDIADAVPVPEEKDMSIDESYAQYADSFSGYRLAEPNVFPLIKGSAAVGITVPDGVAAYVSGFSGGAQVDFIGSEVTVGGDLTSLELPERITAILSKDSDAPESRGAFYENATIERFLPSEGFTYIGNKAFYGCKALKDVFLPMSLTHIGDRAFYGCRSLGSVSIYGECNIGDGAFAGCSSLTDVYLSESVARVGIGAFEHTPFYDGLTDEFCVVGDVLVKYNGKGGNVVIPEGVRIIGDGVFAGRLSILSVSFPQSLEYIGNSAFGSCAHLGEVAFAGGNLPVIGKDAFFGCPIEASDVILKLTVDERNEFLTDAVAEIGTVH